MAPAVKKTKDVLFNTHCKACKFKANLLIPGETVDKRNAVELEKKGKDAKVFTTLEIARETLTSKSCMACHESCQILDGEVAIPNAKEIGSKRTAEEKAAATKKSADEAEAKLAADQETAAQEARADNEAKEVAKAKAATEARLKKEVADKKAAEKKAATAAKRKATAAKKAAEKKAAK